MKIKKGDTVLIISGKDRGKKGKVLEVFPKEKRLLVEGINLRKKHTRPKREGEKGQIVELALPIPISQAKLICPRCQKATRVGYILKEEPQPGLKGKKKKFRICKKCEKEI